MANNYLTDIKKSNSRIERALQLLSETAVDTTQDREIFNLADRCATTTTCKEFGLLLYLYSIALLNYAEAEKTLTSIESTLHRTRGTRNHKQPTMRAFLKYRVTDLATRCSVCEERVANSIPILEYRRSAVLRIIRGQLCVTHYDSCRC